MISFFKKRLPQLRSNVQFFYGILLIVLIPAALAINTLIFIKHTQTLIDAELQRKAALASGIFSESVPSLLGDPASLQALVEKTVAANEEMHSLDVLVPEGENFKILASLDRQRIGTTTPYLYNTLAWQTNEAIAYQTRSKALSTEDQEQLGDERFWVVVKPVTDASGAKVALVSMKVSSKVIDDLVTANLRRSIIILVTTIIVIILLMLNNTRLFQYSLLFRKLKEVDEMKDEFISMASHELRAPIVGIRGYLAMLKDNAFGALPPEASNKVKLLLHETNRLHDLVEDLLDVSRIEQGRIQLSSKELDLAQVFESIASNFTQQAAEKHLALQREIAAGTPHVIADENRLTQVLVNLVSNAIKYTPKGSITLRASLQKEMVKIVVSDTGMGMSAVERERLFEKFYRVRNEKTQAIIGTGLGLWITRELIRMMKGDIFVDSIENVGTHVTVLLPKFQGTPK